MSIPSVTQGQFLSDKDLFMCWFDPQQRLYSPYKVWYIVGIVNENCNTVVPVCGGPKDPYVISTGIMRPNFIVGDKWPSGLYRITWYFQDVESGPVQQRDFDFEVKSAGIYGSRVTLECFFDLPAELQILV
jgi:hypothetical protein